MFYRLAAKIRGKNSKYTPADVIVDQMNEPRPLPMGVKEFHEWSDRIIAGALVPADPVGLKWALAEMIMHLKPTESHCADAYFIHCLRKGAANQVAYAMLEELRKGRKDELKRKEEIDAENFKKERDAKSLQGTPATDKIIQ